MDFLEAEQDCLRQLDTDYMPFHNVFRSLYGFEQLTPDREQFDQTLKLFQFLVNRYALKVFDGLKKEINLDTAVNILNKAYDQGQYETIDYGIWLERVLD